MFLLLDTKAFGGCFLAWVRDVRKKAPWDVVALVGKKLRASMAEGQPALPLVSVFPTINRLVLGQRAVNGKSNEIIAAPELLKVLDVKGNHAYVAPSPWTPRAANGGSPRRSSA